MRSQLTTSETEEFASSDNSSDEFQLEQSIPGLPNHCSSTHSCSFTERTTSSSWRPAVDKAARRRFRALQGDKGIVRNDLESYFKDLGILGASNARGTETPYTAGAEVASDEEDADRNQVSQKITESASREDSADLRQVLVQGDQKDKESDENESEDWSSDTGKSAGSPEPEPETIIAIRESEIAAGNIKSPKDEFFLSITISDDLSTLKKKAERCLIALRGQTKDQAPKQLHIEPIDVLGDFFLSEFLISEEAVRSISETTELVRELADAQYHTLDYYFGSGHHTMADLTFEETGSGHPSADLGSLSQSAENLGLEELQSYIECLQVQAKRMGAPTEKHKDFRAQTLHRILRRAETPSAKGGSKVRNVLSGPFFDPPEVVKGEGGASVLRCTIPVQNLDLYLERNKDVAFIVYQTHIEPANEKMHSRSRQTSGKSTKHTINESIYPLKQEFIDTLTNILESREEYADILQSFRSNSEVLAPYLFFYHHRSDLFAPHTTEWYSAREQLELFSKVVRQSQGRLYSAADFEVSRGKVSNALVPFLFKPGDIVVTREKNHYAGRVVSSWPELVDSKQMSRRHFSETQSSGIVPLYTSKDDPKKLTNDNVLVHQWTFSAWHWEFDGKFARRYDILQFQIKEELDSTSNESSLDELDLSKETSITDLHVYPLRFLSSDIQEKLRQRGQMFWKCRQRRYVSYLENGEDDAQSLEQADERYMIDLETYRSLHNDDQYDSKPHRDDLVDELGPGAMARDECPDSQFELLMPLTIKGYNLRRKKWFDLLVDRIRDVHWHKETFKKVVMDRKAKDLIQALVSNQLVAERATDLIAGKGNGLILLLHGGPGTGKTLTAESVAEIAEKPLYRVTCGDVGTKAEAVEKYLESVFHLGKLWGCVVLLDEADVFLEQRSLEDLERNALVSVFLRVLEYYEGILVLTSNRVGTFDEAFKSRIQLALHYPTLGAYQRLRIWENFFNRLETFDESGVDIADLKDHLEDLSHEKMNGRQIRNAITTARQYSEWKGTTLTYAELKDVIEISGRFDKYLDKLHGGYTQDQLMEDEGIR